MTGLAPSALQVTETDVTVETPDGLCDAVFVHPAAASHPGVLLWPDAFGLRWTFREMGKRLAAEGYAVLIPNPFYRSATAPIFGRDHTSQSREERAKVFREKLLPLTAALRAPGVAERDALAHIAFLNSQDAVKRTSKMGTAGYCMGGWLTMRTAAIAPDRIGAAGSFHGARLVTDGPDSPHLLVPKMKAQFVIAIAEDDDQKQSEAKDKLREAFAAANLTAEIEVYAGAMHGWCTRGNPVYNEVQAERAWTRLLALVKRALV